jgi:hypothetical protein
MLWYPIVEHVTGGRDFRLVRKGSTKERNEELLLRILCLSSSWTRYDRLNPRQRSAQNSTQLLHELATLKSKSSDPSFARTISRLGIPHSIRLSNLTGKFERDVHKKQIAVTHRCARHVTEVALSGQCCSRRSRLA